MATKKTVKEVVSKETEIQVAERMKKEAAKVNVLASKEITDAETMTKNLEALAKMPFVSDEYKEIIANGLPSIKAMIEKAKDVLGIDYQMMFTVDAINTHNTVVETLETEKNNAIAELDEKIASLEDEYKRKNLELSQKHADDEAAWQRSTELAHRSKKQNLEDELTKMRTEYNDTVNKFFSDKKTVEEYIAEIETLNSKIKELEEAVTKAEKQGEAIGKNKATTDAENAAKLVKAEHDAAIQKLEFANKILQEKLTDAIAQRDEAKEDAREANARIERVSTKYAEQQAPTFNFADGRK